MAGQTPGNRILARHSPVFPGKNARLVGHHQVFPRKVPDSRLVMEQFASGAPHNFHNIWAPDHSVQI
jgi:hypothetical protein